MTKADMKKSAIELRKKGYSYNLILKEVPVSKSTLSLWLSDISHTPNKEVKNRVRGAALNVAKWSNARKRDSLVRAKKAAVKELGSLSKRDLFLLGIGLYMGEGAKSQDHVRVINSDSKVIALAMKWFQDIFGLGTENFTLAIHLYPDNDVEKSLDFWSNVTGIPKSQFGKTQIDKRKKKQKKRGMLKYGTAHLNVRSNGEKDLGVFLFRKVMAMIDEVYRQAT